MLVKTDFRKLQADPAFQKAVRQRDALRRHEAAVIRQDAVIQEGTDKIMRLLRRNQDRG